MLIAAALCFVDAAVARPIQVGPAPLTEPLFLETRFAPPLGAVQRFRLTITKRGQTHSWVEEVRFERGGGAYIAHWRMDPASLPPAMRHPLLAPMIRPFTGAPIMFELDEEGSITGVRDWEVQRARLLKIVEDSRPLLEAGSDADKREAGTIVAATRTMFAQLDAQSGAQIILKNLGPVFDWGGYALELGQSESATETVPIPLLGTSIDQRSTVTLTSLEPGVARIALQSEFDGAALRASMERLRALVDNGDPAARARFAKSMAEFDQMRAVQTSTVTLDLATGLPRHVEGNILVDSKMVERVVIEWLKP